MATKPLKTFSEILDTEKPDWWLVYATQEELIDCVRQCTDGRSGTVAAKIALRAAVSARIHDVAKAGVHWAAQL